MANPQAVGEVTSASGWKRDRGEKVMLPSGNVCLLKRPGMEKLFAAGVLPDELTKIAMQQIEVASSGPQDHKKKQSEAAETIDPAMLKKFLEGENAITDIFTSFDRVTAMCVIEPPCHWHMRKVTDAEGRWVRDAQDKPQYEEIPEHERDQNAIYTDDVDIDDKTFIFNFVVGGTRDIESFREEFGDGLATLRSGEDVELPPE